MTVKVGDLFRKRVVRNLKGQIIDMYDEANGGAIISKGRIVNPERYEELQKIEEDKKMAALAETAGPAPSVTPAPIEERNAQPGRLDVLEKKFDGMESNINKILDLLQNKNDIRTKE